MKSNVKYAGSVFGGENVAPVIRGNNFTSKIACAFAESGDELKTTAQSTPIVDTSLRVCALPVPLKSPTTELAEQGGVPAPATRNWSVAGTERSVTRSLFSTVNRNEIWATVLPWGRWAFVRERSSRNRYSALGCPPCGPLATA